jgi:hypothetical protein
MQKNTLTNEVFQILACVRLALYRQVHIYNKCVKSLFMLEVRLNIHVSAVFGLHTHFHIFSTTSKLTLFAQTSNKPPPFCITFDKLR